MKKALPTAVSVDALLDGFKIGEEIPVTEDHAARFAGCTGGKEDLGNIVPCGVPAGLERSSGRRRGGPRNRGQIVVRERRRTFRGFDASALAQNEFYLCFASYALDEVRTRARVHGDDHGATQEDGPEAGEPLETVRAPKENPIAGCDTAGSKDVAPGASCGAEFGVGSRLPAITAVLDDSNITADVEELLEERQEIGAAHVEGPASQ